MPRLLTDPEINQSLKGLNGWKRDGPFIAKTFEFKEFMDGIRFIVDVAKVAEEGEHHPDIYVRYTSVTLSVQTHSEGGVTEWDIGLAQAVEKMLAKSASRPRRKKGASTRA